VNFDYFWEDRTNIFVTGSDRIIPQYYGADAVAANLGRVKVKGWELESDFSKTTNGGFTINAGLSWAYAKDIVVKGIDPEFMPNHRKSEGYPMNQPSSYVHVDIIQNWNDVYMVPLATGSNPNIRPGFVQRVDFDNNGYIDGFDQARYSYPARPQYSYSPKIGFDYKGISLKLNFYGTYNLRPQLLGNSLSAFAYDQDMLHEWVLQTWSPELGNVGEKAKYRSLAFLYGMPYGHDVISRAAFRLKSAIVAYDLNSQLVKNLGISNLRFYINGENLFLWSKMLRDQDDDATETRGYPTVKRLSFGMNLNF
jgi:outer membrane receptor protein involved in Fe transport